MTEPTISGIVIGFVGGTVSWRPGLASPKNTWFITRNVGGNVGLDALLRLVVGALVGAIVYFGLLAAMGAPELDALKRRLLPSDGPDL